MIKSLAVACLIIFLLWGTGICSEEPSPPPAKGQPGIFDPKTSMQRDIKPKYEYDITINAIPALDKTEAGKTNNPAEHGDKKDNDGKLLTVEYNRVTRYTFWLMIFTGCLAICNIALWFYTKAAADAAKKSAEALPVIERAYIFIDACVLEDIEAYRFDFSVVFSNFGKTPAILIKARGACIWGELPPGKFPEIDLPFPDGGVVVKPSGSDSIKISTYIPPDIFGKIAREELRAFCYGIIEYCDIWKNWHETGFCWEVNPDPDSRRARIADSPLNYYT
jgi:hypothetical protein